jgi:hypothetical protein
MIKKFILIILFLLSATHQVIAAENYVKGGFEMTGFFNAGFGWQRFGGGPPTEFDYDGSFAGVLGSVLPEVATGIPPVEGEDIVEAFMEVFELDIIKQITERATLRADILFGRSQSGSWVIVPGIDLEQAYMTLRLSNSPAIDLTIGRIGTQAGFEPFEPYFNDTISWSVLSRAVLYPYIITGVQLGIEFSDHVALVIAAANNLVNDSDITFNDIPSFVTTLKFSWGADDRENYLAISPYLGPEGKNSRPLTYGSDATLVVWPTKSVQLGIEGLYRRDNGDGGPNTDYAGGFFNLHWDITETFFGGLRFSYARQFDDGSGILNLTGAKQSIYESSLFAGYHITDGVMLKFEGRFDVVDPAVGRTQMVPGVAMALAAAF